MKKIMILAILVVLAVYLAGCAQKTAAPAATTTASDTEDVSTTVSEVDDISSDIDASDLDAIDADMSEIENA